MGWTSRPLQVRQGRGWRGGVGVFQCPPQLREGHMGVANLGDRKRNESSGCRGTALPHRGCRKPCCSGSGAQGNTENTATLLALSAGGVWTSTPRTNPPLCTWLHCPKSPLGSNPPLHSRQPPASSIVLPFPEDRRVAFPDWLPSFAPSCEWTCPSPPLYIRVTNEDTSAQAAQAACPASHSQ